MRIAHERFIKQGYRLKESFFSTGIRGQFGQLQGLSIKPLSNRVGGGRLCDSCFLAWRHPSLELVGNRLRNLALNGENIRKIAIVSLRPKMRIRAGVNELSIDPDAVGRALDTTFQNVGNAQLPSDFTKVAGANDLILHHAGATNHLKVCDLGQIGEDLILDAVGKEARLRIRAKIFERQTRIAFFRNRSSDG